MRRGGGVGYDFSRIRPQGAWVGSTRSRASGPVSYMRVFDRSCETVESAGSRRGAQMARAALRPPRHRGLHPRQGRRRPHQLQHLGGRHRRLHAGRRRRRRRSTSCTAPRPSDEQIAAGAHQRDDGLWVYRQPRARALWDQIMRCTYDHAEPGVLFLDRINQDNNLSYCETIAATNPCVTADTWVQTSEGPRQVAQLVGQPFVAMVDGRAVPHRVGRLLRVRASSRCSVLRTREGHAPEADGRPPGARASARAARRVGRRRRSCGRGDELRAERPPRASTGASRGIDQRRRRRDRQRDGVELARSSAPSSGVVQPLRAAGDGGALVRLQRRPPADGCSAPTAGVDAVRAPASRLAQQLPRPTCEALQRMLLRPGHRAARSIRRRRRARADRRRGRPTCSASCERVGFVGRGRRAPTSRRCCSRAAAPTAARAATLRRATFDVARRRCGDEPVYDVTVEDVHAFDANGFMVAQLRRAAAAALRLLLPRLDRPHALRARPVRGRARASTTTPSPTSRRPRRACSTTCSTSPSGRCPRSTPRRSAKRRVGLGFTGLGDALSMLQPALRHAPPRATRRSASRESMRDAAYDASADLARERGAFPLFNADLYLSRRHLRLAPAAGAQGQDPRAGPAQLAPAVDRAHRHHQPGLRRQREQRHRAAVLVDVHAQEAHARRQRARSTRSRTTRGACIAT